MTQEKKLNKTELLRALKFLIISISAGIIQIGAYSLLYYVVFNGTDDTAQFVVQHWVSYLISLVLSVVWNFTINRRYTFKSASNVPVAMAKVAAFYAVFTPLSTWWNAALATAGWHNLVLEAGTMIINFVTEFFYQRFFVFKNSLDTNDVAKKDENAVETCEKTVSEE